MMEPERNRNSAAFTPESFRVTALGTVIEIDVSALGDSSRHRVREAWANARYAGARVADVVLRPHSESAEETMLERLASDVSRAAIAHNQRQLWMLDALAVADDHGHMVAVLCDASVAQELSSRLFARSLRVSVDVIGIDAHGGVRHFLETRPPVGPDGNRPSSRIDRNLASHSAARLSKIILWESDGEQSSGSDESETVGLEVILPTLVSRSRGLGAVRWPLRTLSSLLEVTGGALRIRGRDLDAVSARIVDQLRPPQISVGPSTRLPSTQGTLGVDTRLFRGPSLDEVALGGGRMAVLQRTQNGEELSLLDSTASSVWSAIAGPSHPDRRSAAPATGRAEARARDATLAEMAVKMMVHDGLLRSEPSWRVSDGAAWTMSSMRTTVINLDDPSKHPVVLEGTANVIWAFLVDRMACAQGEIVAECGLLFDIDPESIEDDVIGLLRSLSAEGVIDRL